MEERKSARPINELDMGTRKRMDKILGTEPEGISNEDREFLTARRDYLTSDQKNDYGVKTPKKNKITAKPRK